MPAIPAKSLSPLAQSRRLPLRMGFSTIEDIVARVKVVKYKATSSNPELAVETTDRTARARDEKVLVTRVGGIGLDLAEYQVSDDGYSGVVVVNGVNPGSNAEAAGGFRKGDILVGIEGVEPIETTTTAEELANGEKPLRGSLEGLNLDNTINVMSRFGEYKSVRLKVKRLVPRKVIKVALKGPQGEDAGELAVLSGYGVNLRTALNASNRKIYDDRTYRFDSPYERGDCGGEGTCGTCMVAILSGEELLNDKHRVEEKALLAKNAPPNYRWACRVAIGEKEGDEEEEGEIVVKLRPQTTVWDNKQ